VPRNSSVVQDLLLNSGRANHSQPTRSLTLSVGVRFPAGLLSSKLCLCLICPFQDISNAHSRTVERLGIEVHISTFRRTVLLCNGHSNGRGGEGNVLCWAGFPPRQEENVRTRSVCIFFVDTVADNDDALIFVGDRWVVFTMPRYPLRAPCWVDLAMRRATCASILVVRHFDWRKVRPGHDRWLHATAMQAGLPRRRRMFMRILLPRV
jgi:hypothetical protein